MTVVCFCVLKPCTLRDWELHVHFRVHGSASELYGDGLAIWYTKHHLELGWYFLFQFLRKKQMLHVLWYC